MILDVDHTQITIPKGSEAEARAFYCDFLGLKEIEKPDNRKNNGGFWLLVGNFQIHVGTEDGIERSKTKAHVAYRVDNLHAWEAKIEDKLFTIKHNPPLPNAKAFEFRDPFGNRVELIEHFK